MTRQKLLIIDDSEDIHELVHVWLEGEALEFVSCFSGEDGLTVAPRVRPDLILLDVDLPGIDGFEVCRRIKATPGLVDIPIVFLTGASSTDEKLHGLELGAVDYVTKPFDPAELRARVRASLNTKKLMDLLAQKAVILQESEERFRVLAENSSDVISRYTPKGVYLYASPACFTLLGYSPEQMVGKSLFEFIHPDEVEPVALSWSTAQPLSAATRTLSFRFLRSDGEYVWLESTCRTLIDSTTGAVREIHAAARDITLRKQMENREQIRVEVLEMIAQGYPLNDILRHLIVAVEKQDPNALAAGVMLNGSQIYHCAPNLPSSISFSIEKQMHQFITRFNVLATEMNDRVIVCDLMTDPAWQELRPALKELALRSCTSVLILSRHRDASGAFSIYRRNNQRPDSSTIELMKLAGELISVAVEHRQLTDQLTFQAQHDTLTSLPNRAMFADRLQQSLAAANRSHRPGAVVTVDVDRFKHINDTYGHQAGDELLCQIAKRLSVRLRQSDTLARMGGDEFAIILAELARPEDASVVTQAILQEFTTPVDLCGQEIFVSVSIGSAVFPRDGKDSLTILKSADLALYEAKDAGRNVARHYLPSMSEGAVEQQEIENALRHAVANGELLLHYQPQVDAQGQIKGLEALVRWMHPTMGLISPARFIPIAEDSGLILPIGQWVLQEAARQLQAWSAMGIQTVPIAVNVSTLQFAQPEFISTVVSVLNLPGLPSKWLELELTESLLMRNMADASEKLQRLQDMQVDVAIDDFGTGYSSLAYLQRLSIDTLKIDHSFISAIEIEHKDEGGNSIVKAILSLAKSLGIRVIAEGVETPMQQQLLIDMGCDLMQGFLFSRPKPAEAVEQLLRQKTLPSSFPLQMSA